MKSLVNYHSERTTIYESRFKYLSVNEAATVREEFDVAHNMGLTGCDGCVPEFGAHYYIEFINPFTDKNKFSSTPGSQTQILEHTIIECIGIADKFGRIYLHGVWEESEPAYIEYKQPKSKCNKYGKMYDIKEGWHLTRKDIEAYKVKKVYKAKKPSYIVSEHTSLGAYGIDITSNIKTIKRL